MTSELLDFGGHSVSVHFLLSGQGHEETASDDTTLVLVAEIWFGISNEKKLGINFDDGMDNDGSTALIQANVLGCIQM